ncbi:hypothetical protein F4678DRAFT_349500 [Xylaria arbuscula]|nr:hypothetical protein F4678DRAFT_349500 [Xylaria arbuscula]
MPIGYIRQSYTMVVHERMALGGADNLTASSRQGFLESSAVSQTHARTWEADTHATENYRRKAMKQYGAPLGRDRLLSSNSGSRSAHFTSNSYNQDAPHPPSPPHPPVPNPPPPKNGHRICRW